MTTISDRLDAARVALLSVIDELKRVPVSSDENEGADVSDAVESATESLTELTEAIKMLEIVHQTLKAFSDGAVCPVNESLAPGFVSGAYDGWGRARSFVGRHIKAVSS